MAAHVIPVEPVAFWVCGEMRVRVVELGQPEASREVRQYWSVFSDHPLYSKGEPQYSMTFRIAENDLPRFGKLAMTFSDDSQIITMALFIDDVDTDTGRVHCADINSCPKCPICGLWPPPSHLPEDLILAWENKLLTDPSACVPYHDILEEMGGWPERQRLLRNRTRKFVIVTNDRRHSAYEVLNAKDLPQCGDDYEDEDGKRNPALKCVNRTAVRDVLSPYNWNVTCEYEEANLVDRGG